MSAVDTHSILSTGGTKEDLTRKVHDLLANLRHLCDANGLSFEAISEQAEGCYLEEVAAEQAQIDAELEEEEGEQVL